MTADFIARTRMRPDRGIKIIIVVWPRWTVAITGYLHQPEFAIIVRRQTALFIPLTIATAKSGRLAASDKTYAYREKLSYFIHVQHILRPFLQARLHNHFENFWWSCIDVGQENLGRIPEN